MCRVNEISLTGNESGTNRSLGYFAVKARKLRLQTYFWGFFLLITFCTPDVVAELLNYFSAGRESELKVSSFPL